MQLFNLDRLHGKVREMVQDFCENFIELHANNLRGLFIYGSAAGNGFLHGKSNINMLAALEHVDPVDLKKSLKLIKWGRKKGIAAPLMLTIEHIGRSADVFPLEFLEMKENYVLLYGEDILKDLKIDSKNIRLQCEQQIKGGLVRLYQSYLEVGYSNREIKRLLAESIKSFMPAFRGLLKLKNRNAAAEKNIVTEDLSREFNLNKRVFADILNVREEKYRGDTEILFGEYIEEIEKLGIEVDRMEA
jgi:hypothetical protein